MRRTVATPIRGLVIALATALHAPPSSLEAQSFKTPLSLTHFVYRPGEDADRLENLRMWTFGLGVSVGPSDRTGYGLVAHATYGGPYWYVAGSVGMWNSGSPSTDDFAFGLNYHYNVFQSRDHRTRVGWQAGWSTPRAGDARTHVFDYRAMVSHALTSSLALYGGMGAETSRSKDPAASATGTNPSLMAGVSTRLGGRFALSSGVESVFADPSRLRVAGSLQFQRGPSSSSGPLNRRR